MLISAFRSRRSISFELLNPNETRLFSFNFGVWIRERVGGEMNSLMDTGFTIIDAFRFSVTLATLVTSPISSWLVSDPHELHIKTIRAADTIGRNWC